MDKLKEIKECIEYVFIIILGVVILLVLLYAYTRIWFIENEVFIFIICISVLIMNFILVILKMRYNFKEKELNFVETTIGEVKDKDKLVKLLERMF